MACIDFQLIFNIQLLLLTSFNSDVHRSFDPGRCFTCCVPGINGKENMRVCWVTTSPCQPVPLHCSPEDFLCKEIRHYSWDIGGLGLGLAKLQFLCKTPPFADLHCWRAIFLLANTLPLQQMAGAATCSLHSPKAYKVKSNLITLHY